MRIIIGVYAYLTKLAIIDLKSKLTVPYTYVRDTYDYLLLYPNEKTVAKITQDGLMYLDSQCEISDIPDLCTWLNVNIRDKIELLDDEDFFYRNIFSEKPPTIIIFADNAKVDTSQLFAQLNRTFDYSIKTNKLEKDYGDGLIVFKKSKLSEKDLANLIEYQIILADYQNLIKCLLNSNKLFWTEVSKARKQDEFVYKDLPELVDGLLDMRKDIDAVLHRIHQLDDTLLNRELKCTIKPILKILKLDDFSEMVRLNKYVTDQFEMTRDYITSTVELVQLLYQENEQKELNILQVIFAVGTIASLISLSGVSNDEVILSQESGKLVGQMFTFDMQSMLLWSGISILIGVVVFIILNYAFLHAKKQRIVQLTKTKKKFIFS